MNAHQSAFLPEDEVEIGDITETNDELRIGARSLKVNLIGDSICSLPSTGSEHRPDAGVTQCIIEVFNALLVTPSEVSYFPEDGFSEFDLQTPRAKNISASVDAVLLGSARRGDDANAIADARPSGTPRFDNIHLHDLKPVATAEMLGMNIAESNGWMLSPSGNARPRPGLVILFRLW
jgi:hypothetical protein